MPAHGEVVGQGMPGLGGSHVAFWDECAPGRFGDTGEWKLCKAARVDG